jgi:hypothetical protein
MALTVLQPWGANSAATFTFGGLSVTGNATVGNISATNLGNISSINLTGNSSNVLYGNGIFAAASGGAGTPGGLNTYVQFNDASTFGGNASFTYNKATNTLTAGNIGGTLTTAAQTNITSVGTLSSLAVTGNITSGNLSGTHYGAATGLTSIPGANVTGTVNNSTYFNTVSSVTFAEALRSNRNINGGGTISVDGAAYVGWTSRYIVISNGNGTNFSTSGYFDITQPIVGTITGVGGATNVTATAAGIQLQAWQALYYILPIGSNSASLNANFRIVTFTGALDIPHDWVLICVVNGDNNRYYFNNGITLTAGTSYATATYSSTLVPVASSATTAGTVTTAAQPNITSVGTLTSLAVTGNITSGNFVGTLNGSGANVTSISATNISTGTLAQARLANTSITLGSTALTLGATVTTVAGLTSVTSTTFVGALTGAATTAGTVTTAAQPNITSVGTLTSLAVTGNVTGGNLSGTSIVGTLTTAAQTNITSVGTLTSLAVTGNITGGNLSVNSGKITVGNIVNSNGNGIGNIGSSTLYFNTVFAKATSAQYADLAELYTTDNINYPPGTCVAFGGTDEITQTTAYAQTDVAGVVSTNPAYIMNAGTDGLPVALQGRVPCRVIGTISKGDLVTSSNTAGVATRLAPEDWRPGAVIGKSLQHFDSDQEGVIEVVVGRV